MIPFSIQKNKYIPQKISMKFSKKDKNVTCKQLKKNKKCLKKKKNNFKLATIKKKPQKKKKIFSELNNILN